MGNVQFLRDIRAALGKHLPRIPRWAATWGWTGVLGFAFACEAAGEYLFALLLSIAAWMSLFFSAFNWTGIEDSPALTRRGRRLGQIAALLMIPVSAWWIGIRKDGHSWSNLSGPISSFFAGARLPKPFLPTMENWAAKQHFDTQVPIRQEPSFVYVAPGYWTKVSGVWGWAFLVRHGGGHDPVNNVEIMFSDDDRQKAIQTDNSIAIRQLDRTLNFPEIDEIEGVQPKQFFWPPLDPNHSNFTVVVASRQGAFRETLKVDQVGLQHANPDDKPPDFQYAFKVIDERSRRVLLWCRDPMFPSSVEFSKKLPRCFPDYTVPGVKSR